MSVIFISVEIALLALKSLNIQNTMELMRNELCNNRQFFLV